MDFYNNTSQNLSTLHSNIQLEAERMIRWKLQTELQVRDKERKLELTSGIAQTQKKDIQRLQKQNDELYEKIKNIELKKIELKDTLLYTITEVNVLTSQIETLKSTLAVAQSDQLKLQDILAQKESSLQDLLSKFHSLNLSTTEKVTAAVEKCNLFRIKSETEIQSFSEEIQNLGSNLEKIGEEKESISKCLAEKEAKLSEAIELSEMQEAENLQLRSQLSQLDTEKDIIVRNMTEMCEASESNILSLNAELTEKMASRQVLEDVLMGKSDRLASLSNDIAMVSSQKEAVLNELSSLKAEHDISKCALEQIEQELNIEKEVIDNLRLKEKELESLKYDHKMLSEDFQVVTERCTALETEIVELTLIQKEKFCLQHEKLELDSKILELEKKISDTVADFQAKLATVEINLKDTKQDLEKYLREEEDNKEQHNKLMNLKVLDVEKQKKTILDLEAEVVSKTADIIRMESDIEKINQQLADATSSLDEKRSDNAKYREDLKEKASEIGDLNDSLAALSEIQTVGSDNVKNKGNEAEDLAEEKNRLISELEEKTLKLATKTEEAKQAKDSSSEEFAGLLNQLKKVSEKLIVSEKREEKIRKQLLKNENTLRTTEKELSETKTKSKEHAEQIIDLRKINEGLTNERDELDARIRARMLELEKSKSELDLVKQENAHLDEKRNHLKQQLEDIQNETKECCILEEESKNETIEKMKENEETLSRKIHVLELKLGDFSIEKRRQIYNNSMLKKESKSLEDELNNLKNKNDAFTQPHAASTPKTPKKTIRNRQLLLADGNSGPRANTCSSQEKQPFQSPSTDLARKMPCVPPKTAYNKGLKLASPSNSSVRKTYAAASSKTPKPSNNVALSNRPRSAITAGLRSKKTTNKKQKSPKKNKEFNVFAVPSDSE